MQKFRRQQVRRGNIAGSAGNSDGSRSDKGTLRAAPAIQTADHLRVSDIGKGES